MLRPLQAVKWLGCGMLAGGSDMDGRIGRMGAEILTAGRRLFTDAADGFCLFSKK
jgi:hypothetical protein